LKKIISIFALAAFLSFVWGCNTNKPAEEVIDAKDRVKKKVEDGRQDEIKAAEETGEAPPKE
jgi:PBP1b-binding outer membrane lipoprotein LpoB